MRRAYHIVDVFTDRPFAGNPLAVVLDADGLDAARMQAVAREFNLSETVFVLTPNDPVNSARLRIFTPGAELPFAGHPTVGAAALLAHLRAPEILARGELSVVLEEEVGLVACLVRRGKGALAARFTLPRLPAEEGPAPADEALARALGLEPADIGFGAHRPSVWSAGLPLVFVPVASRAALGRVEPDRARLLAALGARIGVYVYCGEPEGEGRHVQARMFAPSQGFSEDPATGSAAAAFAGLAMVFERPEDGEHLLLIEQGYAIGRPSVIELTMRVEGGALVEASVGGGVALVAQGTIEA